ncbi:stage II sporulation protein R [Kyrpidia spormannii]|uniref:Stage II sporulation protein R n=1 Tax=Kyrpidia spormannii TaxID=2055160 RepID=A0A6F9EHF0_9BACL|nr:stage II sporulation protein R [Kyrpidia spormannii]CAB3396291.1 Stage II sporulation protein R [Kyrpidia spormannii]
MEEQEQQPKRPRPWAVWLWRVMVGPLALALTLGVGWIGALLPDRSWRPQEGSSGVPVTAAPGAFTPGAHPAGTAFSTGGQLPPLDAPGGAGGSDGAVIPIPNQAIRLRIIANSDRSEDQAVKLKVRDKIIQLVSDHLKGVTTADEARARLRALVPQAEAIAQEEVRAAGFHYPVRADFGMVPFPTKIYGDQVYPAGRYEALRITLGSGLGTNWWCVLFPPLCFVDLTNGDAVPTFHEKGNVTTVELPGVDGHKQPVVIRWFIVELIMKIVEWFRHLW